MLEWLELEEQVGRAWHRLVGERATYPDHPAAAVTLAAVRPMLAVLFRGLGGPLAAEVGAVSARDSAHRLTWRQRLGMDGERLELPSLGETGLRLPGRLALFPDPARNRDLYVWLAAFFATPLAGEFKGGEPADGESGDPLHRDLAFLRAAHRRTEAALAAFPGLRARHGALAEDILALRPRRPLSPIETRVEAVIHGLLARRAPEEEEAAMLWLAVTAPAPPEPGCLPAAPRGYRPFLPVPLWGAVVLAAGDGAHDDDTAEDGEPTAAPRADDDDRRRAAARALNDQADREDPIILNRFEKILTLAEMVNVNRGKDDDDEDSARKAADDLDQLTVSPNKRRAATRLRLDLDLPPDTRVGEALHGTQLYPEWDFRAGVLRPDHCRVITEPAGEEGEDWEPDEAARRLIHSVRRRFEALRPRTRTFTRQVDGDDLDLEAVVRARCDLAATGEGSDRLYIKTRAVARDLSVAVLVDVSLSTDAWVDNRRVLDVEKETLSVFLSGLAACGDENAVFTFTSRKRDWVRVQTVKGFDQPFGPAVLRRIAALKPGYYTRMGAAVRHVAAQLEQRPHRHRLLLVLTDGKPNDVDHYEGRFGIEDTRRAVLDARRRGLSVFGVTIDRRAQEYFPALFGRGHYAIVGEVGRLSRALPRLYQSLAQ